MHYVSYNSKYITGALRRQDVASHASVELQPLNSLLLPRQRCTTCAVYDTLVNILPEPYHAETL